MHFNKRLILWTNFKVDAMKRFNFVMYRDLSRELAKIQQTITIQEFYNIFEELSNVILGIPVSFLPNYFEIDLRIDIRREVRAL